MTTPHTVRQEGPLILEIVQEKEGMMRDEEGGRRDPTKEITSRQKEKKLIRKNRERLQSTKYDSPGHWEKPLEKPPNVQLSPRQNTNMPNTRISDSG